MCYSLIKRHIGGRTRFGSWLSPRESDVGLGSARELPVRPQTVTPGSSSRLSPTRVIAPRVRETQHIQSLRPTGAKPCPGHSARKSGQIVNIFCETVNLPRFTQICANRNGYSGAQHSPPRDFTELPRTLPLLLQSLTIRNQYLIRIVASNRYPMYNGSSHGTNWQSGLRRSPF